MSTHNQQFIQQVIKRVRQNKLKDLNPPQFNLVNACQIQFKRKMVTIIIGGFLSQSRNPSRKWKKLIQNMPDSEIYILNWPAYKPYQFMSYLSETKDEVFKKLKISKFGSKINSALEQFNYRLFEDNPFLKAFKVSQNVGKCLAHVLIQLFPHQMITFLGHSLGSELIKSCLEQFSVLNKQKLINRVIFWAGVADRNQISQLLKVFKYPFKVTNCWMKNDKILKYILALPMKERKPCGRGIIELEYENFYQITNINCGNFIDGHGGFHDKLRQMSIILGLFLK